ncbi:MAG TPA: hypothetical protein VFT19_10790 [Solirubrobacterales bacterium]|nr:hypothetical protein [Solirubrobacterales bacterium]
MSYRVSITPTGQRSVDALRGKARKSFDAAVKRLAAEGCAFSWSESTSPTMRRLLNGRRSPA